MDNLGRQPLHLACESGQLDVVRYLVENILYLSDAMTYRDYNQATPLHYAASNGHLEVVKYFKTSPQAEDKLNRTPLTCACACASAQVEVVKLLLMHGDRDHNGLACQIVQKIHRPDLIQLILSHHTKKIETTGLLKLYKACCHVVGSGWGLELNSILTWSQVQEQCNLKQSV